MKTLVAYYSRTGNTNKIAKQIAKELKTDIDEIKDKTNRKGFLNLIKAGFHAISRKETKIKTKKDPSKYDLVIIGTPVWAGRETPAVRTYLKNNKFNKVAFFCTCGSKQGKSFRNMQRLSKKPLAKLKIKEKQVPGSKNQVKKFCVYLK